mmetsp:Transcript_90806/g.203200  ORF Transcript_90806/g.203200 Transcript_90806/m.203200 type:complete len:323 (+) Transcript_90806:729-1697(+)
MLLLRVEIHDLVQDLGLWAEATSLHLHQEVAGALQVAGQDGGLDHQREGALGDFDTLLRQLVVDVPCDIRTLEVDGATEHQLGVCIRFLGGILACLVSAVAGDLCGSRRCRRLRWRRLPRLRWRRRGRRLLVEQERPLLLLPIESHVVEQGLQVLLLLLRPQRLFGHGLGLGGLLGVSLGLGLGLARLLGIPRLARLPRLALLTALAARALLPPAATSAAPSATCWASGGRCEEGRRLCLVLESDGLERLRHHGTVQARLSASKDATPRDLILRRAAVLLILGRLELEVNAEDHDREHNLQGPDEHERQVHGGLSASTNSSR